MTRSNLLVMPLRDPASQRSKKATATRVRLSNRVLAVNLAAEVMAEWEGRTLRQLTTEALHAYLMRTPAGHTALTEAARTLAAP